MFSLCLFHLSFNSSNKYHYIWSELTLTMAWTFNPSTEYSQMDVTQFQNSCILDLHNHSMHSLKTVTKTEDSVLMPLESTKC